MKKKTMFLLAVMFLLVGGTLAGCGAKSSTKKSQAVSISKIGKVKEDKKLHTQLPTRIKKAGEIKNGIDDAYPPMDFKDSNGNLTGFDIDVGKALGAKLGVKVNNVPTDWDGVIPSLQSKKFDMILSAMGITAERAKSVSFSKPYFNGGMTIITNKKVAASKNIKKLSNLKGKTVGVQAGAQAIVDKVENVKGVKQIKKYDSATLALQDLANKRIDAYVDDFQVANYYMQKVEGTYSKSILNVKEPYGIAFRKDDGELQSAVQKALDSLKKDGTLSKISKKWFDYDVYK
ncbi:ABC transporter substrate-binding protein [Liquorilactobacillus uvarum]|uniref:ABC transporter substrate-binding protein n=1 Tax=Liquorilactobacillus uvarum TaxID=303240 RepID=UPI002889414B|nr:transporter substrate-binding domain-containing protein [Liquorilactobacillus uvarum]